MGEDKETNPWEELVDIWIEFNKSGRNGHRDYLNLPAFMDALPKPRENHVGLEIGGGEGTLARLMAKQGYRLQSIDISEKMIQEARRIEEERAKGDNEPEIQYIIASGEDLSAFKDSSFDFAVAFMSMMDMHHPDKCIKEVYRILKTEGYFQISIVHPCFGSTPHSKHVKDENGVVIARETGGYNNEGYVPIEWKLSEDKKFTTFHNHMKISSWIMIAVNAGFRLEYIEEPFATPEIIERCPHLAHTVTVPDNLLFRLRKD